MRVGRGALGAGMMCSAAPRAPTADSRQAGGGATAAAAGAVLPAAPRSKPPPSSAAHPDAAHTAVKRPGVKYCSYSSTSPAASQAKLMVAHLAANCGWEEWPSELHTYDFGYTVRRPLRSQKLDLCNASYWSQGFGMCIKETDWLFDRLKLAELTGSMNCATSTICPATFVIPPKGAGMSDAQRCASLPRRRPPPEEKKKEKQKEEEEGAASTCWFLKENLQNFGLGTTCLSHPDAATVLPFLLRDDKGYVLQPHVARPVLFHDDSPRRGQPGGGRKFHMRLYLLIAQSAVWAREPLRSVGGARFYAHTKSSKLVVSPNVWESVDTDPATQITTARGATSFSQWSESATALAAMLEAAPQLMSVLQPKLVTPSSSSKVMFELVGADYMLDVAVRAQTSKHKHTATLPDLCLNDFFPVCRLYMKRDHLPRQARDAHIHVEG